MKKTFKKNHKFGNLRFLRELNFRDSQGKAVRDFVCKCVCGKEKQVRASNLIYGSVTSCGCLRYKTIASKKTTHGMSKHVLYLTFSKMKHRCNRKNNPGYKYYGGRGIKVEWKNFEEFYKDMAPTYKKGLSIDRINNDGNYSKKNCRWTTRKVQQNNRGYSVLYKGENATDAGKRLGGSNSIVHERLLMGWSKKDAFTKPKRIKKIEMLKGE